MGTRAQEIRDLGAEIVGIAVTATFSQMAFAEHLGIDFPLLGDWEGTVADAYGVRYDTWKGHRGVAKRSLFVVDRDGTITSSWVTDDALVIPNMNMLVAAVRECVEGAASGR